MPFPVTHNFTYYRGDTFEFDIALKNQDGTDFDLALYENLIFKIANKRGSGATQIEASASAFLPATVRCKITPSVGRTLAAGEYVFDVQITDVGSSYIPSANITFWAQWVPVSIGTPGGTPDPVTTTTTTTAAPVTTTTTAAPTTTPPPVPEGQYRVTWNANGGTGGTTTTLAAGLPHVAPVVTRPGFTMSNWRNPETGGTPIFLSPTQGPNTIYTVLTGTITVIDDISGAV